MAAFSNIDGEESATVTFRVGTVEIVRGTTSEHQEILVVGDPDTSNAIARVTQTAPASTNAGLNVRILSGPSSLADFSVRAVLPSTYGDHGLRVLQSSAADLNVTVAGYSTTVNVSSIAGPVIVRSSAADFAATISGNVGQASTVWAAQIDGRVRAQNSTIGDLLASVQQNSTVWAVQVDGRVRAQNSTIGDLLASVQQNSTVWQVQNKPVFPSVLSTSQLLTSSHSTAVYSLISSEAGLRHKVCAYFVGSTHTNPSTLVFMSSLAIDRWHVNFGSGSSGITGANMANAIPIFVTDAANALNCRIEGGSSVTATVVTRVSFSYVTEA